MRAADSDLRLWKLTLVSSGHGGSVHQPNSREFHVHVVGLWWVTHRRQCDKRACVALDIGSESWALLDVGVGNDKVESGPREWWERKFKIAIFLFQKKLN